MKYRLVLPALALALVACAPVPPVVPTPWASAPAAAVSTPTPTPTRDPAKWVVEENEKPGTTDWTLTGGQIPTEQLAGFADKTSYASGDPVTLRVTSQVPTWTAEVYRLGFYQGTGGRLVWTSQPQTGQVQPAPRVLEGNMVSAATWSPSLKIDTTGYVPGSYLVKLVAPNKQARYVPFTVHSADFKGRLVLLSATTTYQAYNEWGGYSLYRGPGKGFDDRARRVSYDRPYDTQGARHVVGYEQNVVFTAERLGLNLGYAASEDIDAGPNAFAGARGIVSPGHDEYWSPGMRSTVETLRDQGTNLAFLGANAVYWRVRYAASELGERRIVEGYKSAAEDPVKTEAATAMWRQSPSPKPESSLVGMLYECFPAEGALVVHDPDFFLFQGTGATKGSSYPGLIGTEIDRAYPGSLAPPTLRVVAHSPVQCGKVGTTYSDVTYYTTPSGAGVFAAGTMNWTYGLQGAPQAGTGQTQASLVFATKVTENLFAAMAAGPMGTAHPVVTNISEINPNPSTKTGTGGGVG